MIDLFLEFQLTYILPNYLTVYLSVCLSIFLPILHFSVLISLSFRLSSRKLDSFPVKLQLGELRISPEVLMRAWNILSDRENFP